jgi:hypothetical protein
LVCLYAYHRPSFNFSKESNSKLPNYPKTRNSTTQDKESQQGTLKTGNPGTLKSGKPSTQKSPRSLKEAEDKQFIILFSIVSFFFLSIFIKIVDEFQILILWEKVKLAVNVENNCDNVLEVN